MRPDLFDIFGFPIDSYGVSKALTALVAARLLGREFKSSDLPWSMAHSKRIVPLYLIARSGQAGDTGAPVHLPSVAR